RRPHELTDLDVLPTHVLLAVDESRLRVEDEGKVVRCPRRGEHQILLVDLLDVALDYQDLDRLLALGTVEIVRGGASRPGGESAEGQREDGQEAERSDACEVRGKVFRHVGLPLWVWIHPLRARWGRTRGGAGSGRSEARPSRFEEENFRPRFPKSASFS